MVTVVDITAAVRTSARAAALSITVTGAAVGETMTVWRRVGTAALVQVMGAASIPAASRVVIDPEAPLNRAASWVVTTSTGASDESSQLTVPSPLSAIADPVSGVLADVAVITRDTASRINRVTVVQVEGDPTPWIVADVPMDARVPLRLLATSAAATTKVWQVLATGEPVLLRCGCGQHADVWVQPVGDAVSSEPLVATGGDLTAFDLGECVVFAGNPDLTSLARSTTLGDVDAAVTPHTLGAIATRWATLGEIAAADLGS